MSQIFSGNGKLLLTGEYVVLDGAKALALPTKLGQQLSVTSTYESSKKIYWQALKNDSTLWFDCILTIDSWEIIATSSQEKTERLIQIFKAIQDLNPVFFNNEKSFNFISKLDFPEDWGLGSSSTLIHNLATWSNVNPYSLLEKTFGGSGFDIACAANNQPIIYQKKEKPLVDLVNFMPDFSDDLGFVYLNKKQNSRNGIIAYRTKKKDVGLINAVSNITTSLLNVKKLTDFEELLNEHGKLISNHLQIQTAKKIHFNDYEGSIKSLGAWGGDFVLATKYSTQKNYFNNKGYTKHFGFNNLIFS